MEHLNAIQQLGFMDGSHLDKLLVYQPDVMQTKHDGKSFLHHAILSDNLAIVTAVLERGGFSDDPDSEGRTPLLTACRHGQLWTVHRLLTDGADVSATDARGAGCAHAAAAAGQLTILQYLQEVAGLSLSEGDGDGRTPLMMAAATGHVHVVQYLMEQARPSLLSSDSACRTALHVAAAAGHQHVCWLLVTAGSGDLLAATDAEGRMPHQLSAITKSPCGRLLSDLYRRRSSGRGLPSPRPAQVFSLLRLAIVCTVALLACRLAVPEGWETLLNPALMVAALLTLRGQSHRINHPSRAPSWFAVGAVLTLLVASVACALLYMHTYALVPAYVTVLSGAVTCACVLGLQRAVTAAPGAVPPAPHLADTLRALAATPTGQLTYCPLCQVVLSEDDRHCRLCCRCIRGYDHHCLYIVNCVAAANRRAYLRCLLACAVGCLTFLGHVCAYLQHVETAGRRWIARLAGSDIYIGSCAVGHVAALLLLRSLLSHELTYLWRAAPGHGFRKLTQMVRYMTGGTLNPQRRASLQC